MKTGGFGFNRSFSSLARIMDELMFNLNTTPSDPFYRSFDFLASGQTGSFYSKILCYHLFVLWFSLVYNILY